MVTKIPLATTRSTGSPLHEIPDIIRNPKPNDMRLLKIIDNSEYAPLITRPFGFEVIRATALCIHHVCNSPRGDRFQNGEYETLWHAGIESWPVRSSAQIYLASIAVVGVPAR